jgi:hypothetical protein
VRHRGPKARVRVRGPKPPSARVEIRAHAPKPPSARVRVRGRAGGGRAEVRARGGGRGGRGGGGGRGGRGGRGRGRD